ncbi:Crp/Fnr family transcriptional regulator [Pseudomonas sp. NPDC087612]|uniref:Crp/Fnr family transcriptional regulator n=1 Tax=unclassified Pseudomonas TaxID=196821 RepID=UPI0005EAF31F|nr:MULTISPECIES: Crp/Fnr family transcriptional regulator [unclassified Pseudomonas]KJK17522.1 Crp/Fnr family transcriptional regulator [Pseudomonas sp. 2(2015)]QPG63485.1 Crp/Fnr family transcriptional regulator [Pseudomonas sp. BIGb0427]QVM97740.1 Crp/Fnr family transcriptional regulator [Pseudomonas sp. SORT22]UVM65937.1 Crp/Fnr family transcriptional regulator [Pseudomonas sp. B21-009]SDQ42438.1 cAMP-binding domain of CRP or a regulatory subunit of cAMP-dependent protein kinases [Pseudomon
MRETLLQGHWFQALPPSFQDSLLALARPRQLAAGQYLFQRGDAPCGLYAVLDGAMRVGAVATDGKEALLTLIEAPHWFGEISLFDGQPRTHDAQAEGLTQLLWIPQAPLLKLLDQQPRHWRDVALLMSHKLRVVFVALEQQSLLAAAPRVAHRLLQIAAGYGELLGSRRVLQLSQEQLALMLSLSRQTTNQILKSLQQEGALRLGYGEIEILDPARLQALASPAGTATD